MEWGILMYLGIIILMILLTAFFSMSETSFTSANKITLISMENAGNKRATTALWIIDRYDIFLSSVLIGVNICCMFSGSAMTGLLSYMIFEGGVATVISTVCMTLILMLFGDVIPKTMAKRNPEKICLKLTPAVYILVKVLYPLTWVFGKIVAYINGNWEEDEGVSPEELEIILDQSEESLGKDQSELMRSAIRINNAEIADVCISKEEMVAAEVNTSIEEVGRIIFDSKHSRIPIYEGTIDNVIGLISSKQFYMTMYDLKGFSIRDILRPIRFYSGDATVADTLKDMLDETVQMGIILDQGGGTLGMVTLKGLLEELVGGIHDESDITGPQYAKVDNDTYEAQGMADIRSVAAAMGAEIDLGDYAGYSVTGYLVYRLRRAPKVGDVVISKDVSMSVVDLNGRRIKKVVFKTIRR